MFSQIALATARQLRAGTTLVVRTATATSAAPSFLRRGAVVFQQRGYSSAFSRQSAAESDDTAATATKTKKSTRSTAAAAKSKKPATKKPAAKKAATGAAAKKTKKPAAKKEAAPKKKPGPVRKKPVLTEEQKQKLTIKLLKQRAFLKEEPKVHFSSAWALYLRDHLSTISKPDDDRAARNEYMRKAAVGYNALSAAEKEVLEARAVKHHDDAVAAREAWVRTKTPMEITAANHARQRLKRLGAIKAVHLIPDDRAPKRPRTPFSWFVMTKNKEGVFQSGGTPTEVMKALGEEWRSMDAAAKQPYIDNCAVDQQRYYSETKATAAQYAA